MPGRGSGGSAGSRARGSRHAGDSPAHRLRRPTRKLPKSLRRSSHLVRRQRQRGCTIPHDRHSRALFAPAVQDEGERQPLPACRPVAQRPPRRLATHLCTAQALLGAEPSRADLQRLLYHASLRLPSPARGNPLGPRRGPSPMATAGVGRSRNQSPSSDTTGSRCASGRGPGGSHGPARWGRRP